jgi:septal ring factor EnvC (AmiA/AmiB activator)
MLKHIFNTIAVLLVLLSFASAQQVTKAELVKALKACEQDLDSAKVQIRTLSDALEDTNRLIDKRATISDSLIANLKYQLFLQDSVTALFKANTDTLQRMVADYSQKLDEVNKLYVHELERQTRPWFLTGNGLKGLSYGLFVGAALGLVFAVAL